MARQLHQMTGRRQPFLRGMLLHIVALCLSVAALAMALPLAPAFAEGEAGSSVYEAMRHEWQRTRPDTYSAASGRHFAARTPLFYQAPPQQPFFPQTTRSMRTGRDIPLLTVRPLNGVYGSLDPGLGMQPRRPWSRTGAGNDDRETENRAVNGPQAYCVRSCDGFFFPAGPASSGKTREAQNYYCRTACPGAEVTLYSAREGETIDNAVNHQRQNYQSLKTAFQFRTQLSAACTCSSGMARGLATIPISHDFTLRKGDLVVTDRGVSLFKGASRFPYKNSDFMLARNYSRLPADVRHAVSTLESGRSYGEPGRIGAMRSARLPQTHLATAQPIGAGTMSQSGVRVLDLSRTAAITSPASLSGGTADKAALAKPR